MPRHAPGAWGTFIIIAAVAVIMYFDRRRQRRADRLNEQGRCARCGAPLLGMGHRAPVSGGPRFVHTGQVCDACYLVVRRHERIVWGLLALALVTSLVLAWQEGHAPAISARGVHLDHVPIAVRDLPAATAEFEELGFTIKSGRPHANGIENASIKFADGSYLELITAHDGLDAISREYRDFLQRQEGARYAFLRDDESSDFTTRVLGAGGHRTSSGPFEFTELPDAWHAPGLQLIRYVSPAADDPSIFRHANTARRLVSVWITEDQPDSPLARALGATPGGAAAWAFTDRRADVVPLADGSCLNALPREAADPREQTVAAVLVEVDSLGRLPAAAKQGMTVRGPASWLTPLNAHGIWLGFIERAAWGRGMPRPAREPSSSTDR
jgi:hypothetical protein